MLMASPPRALPDVTITAWSGLLVATTAAVVLSRGGPTSGTTLLLAAAVGSLPAVLCAVAVSRRRPRAATPADRVTLTRAVLASGCAAITVLVLADAVPSRTWWLVALTVPTLLLDAVDGPVARRTGTVTEAGGRLDMQVDAGVLLVLSVAVAPLFGVWVVLIGAMRYVFVAASWVRPSLRIPLPRSAFRRVVAGLQGCVLAFAIAPVVPVSLARATLLLALGLLFVSFASQVVLQERQAAGPRLSDPSARPSSTMIAQPTSQAA